MRTRNASIAQAVEADIADARIRAILRLHWPEVEQRASAAVHCKGHRIVQVRDPPTIVCAPKTGGCPVPKVDVIAVGLATGLVAQARHPSHIVLSLDREVARRDLDGPVPGLEPCLV